MFIYFGYQPNISEKDCDLFPLCSSYVVLLVSSEIITKYKYKIKATRRKVENGRRKFGKPTFRQIKNKNNLFRMLEADYKRLFMC